jgi:hypothetical protein
MIHIEKQPTKIVPLNGPENQLVALTLAAFAEQRRENVGFRNPAPTTMIVEPGDITGNLDPAQLAVHKTVNDYLRTNFPDEYN